MFTRFEEYAASSMLGQPDSPPRAQGRLRFDRPWEREAFGLALSRDWSLPAFRARTD